MQTMTDGHHECSSAEVWALLALEEAHGRQSTAILAWCEHLLYEGEGGALLAHLLVNSHSLHLLYLERRIGMASGEAIRRKAGALIASPRVGRCFLASLSDRFPLNDEAARNAILREAERIGDEPCMVDHRAVLRQTTSDYHALYASDDREAGLSRLARDFKLRFNNATALLSVPPTSPRTRSMSAEQYLGSWGHVTSLVSAALGQEGQEVIKGSDWGLSRAKWLLGYLLGEDAEWLRYKVGQSVKFDGGGDERGMGHEPFTLVHSAERTLLAYRVMQFDRHIMPRSGAPPRTWEEACAVIDAIADAEAKAVRPASDFGPPGSW